MRERPQYSTCSSGSGSEGSINTFQVCVYSSTTTAATFTMVFKLYGSYRSPWVRLVATVLLEKQVPFELVPVDLPNGEHKSPEYLEKHPFGQIPYIVCDSPIFVCQRNRDLFNISCSIRMMTASSSTKAKLYAIISRRSMLIKGRRYFRVGSKPMRSTSKPCL